MEINFQRYIDAKKNSRLTDSVGAGREYAHITDYAVSNAIGALSGLKYSIESIIKSYVNLELGNLMRSGVQVSPRQFPKIYTIAATCARTLDIPVPRIFVQYEEGVNAYTFGTNLSSYIVITPRLIEVMTENELAFVIGHECGHIHNSHVTYLTIAQMLLENFMPASLQFVADGMSLPLKSWQRKAEITSDRAGLICCNKLAVAQRALAKTILGGYGLDEEYSIETLVEQAQSMAGGGTLMKFSEMFATHPHVVKRIAALGLFVQSHLYHQVASLPPGPAKLMSRQELDRKISKIVQVLQ